MTAEAVPTIGRAPDDSLDPLPPLEPNSSLFLAAVQRLRQAHGVLECWLRGGSMGRAIPAGSGLRVVFVEPDSYRPGQVVAFLTGRRMCVHRIVYRGRRTAARSCLLTRGDRCLLPDPPVDIGAVLGPVAEFSPDRVRWLSTGPPERRPPWARALSFAALMILAGLVEIDVRFAQWLVRRVRQVVRAVRGNAQFPPAESRSAE